MKSIEEKWLSNQMGHGGNPLSIFRFCYLSSFLGINGYPD